MDIPAGITYEYLEEKGLRFASSPTMRAYKLREYPDIIFTAECDVIHDAPVGSPDRIQPRWRVTSAEPVKITAPSEEHPRRQSWPLIPKPEFGCSGWVGKGWHYFFSFYDNHSQVLFIVEIPDDKALWKMVDAFNVYPLSEVPGILTRAWESGTTRLYGMLLDLMKIGVIEFVPHSEPDPGWYTLLRRLYDGDLKGSTL
jgi:hypothetical protein